MSDSGPTDSPKPERRRSSRRPSWLFGRAKKRSTASGQASHEDRVEILSRSQVPAVAANVLALAADAREAVVCTFVELRWPGKANHAIGTESGADDVESGASALASVFRRSDVIARWTSNCFVVLSVGPGPESDDVERRMAKQLQTSGGGDPGDPAVTIAAGRVVHMPWQDENLDQIVQRADQEMLRQLGLRRARDSDEE